MKDMEEGGLNRTWTEEDENRIERNEDRRWQKQLCMTEEDFKIN